LHGVKYDVDHRSGNAKVFGVKAANFLVPLPLCLAILFGAVCLGPASAVDAVSVSIYCTAGEVQALMADVGGREAVLRAIMPLKTTRLFLEGRRGDQYVAPERLSEIRDFFLSKGIHCSGGIATVPGVSFGVRQRGGLDWLNWETRKTQSDVAGFFEQNAPLFPELIVDDFFCTGDESAESALAKGSRTWGEYRRDLLVSLMEPCMFQPARQASKRTRLIIKFPQWYDLFHVYGYDPPRMMERFSQVWVGTEVRNPGTRRMGFVQPTQGYMNFRWLTAQGGQKVRGAWFDHIECDAQLFVDQAYASVLAGARELTLFSLGEVMRSHPGDILLANKLPDLINLARRVHGKAPRGIAFYKPAGSDSEENVHLADYLAMIGLPVVPVAEYPADAKIAFLAVQAAADAKLVQKIQRHLRRGATVVLTPALLRALGPQGAELAEVDPGRTSAPALARSIASGGDRAGTWTLEVPLEIDGGVKPSVSEPELVARTEGGKVPFLACRSVGRGRLLTLNVRTFSHQDFLDAQEYLLAPKPLGITRIPQSLADRLREELLAPLGCHFQAPPGVHLVLLGNSQCVYNYRDNPVRIQTGAEPIDLAPHAWVWRERQAQ
jgi:hypothetical protein